MQRPGIRAQATGLAIGDAKSCSGMGGQCLPTAVLVQASWGSGNGLQSGRLESSSKTFSTVILGEAVHF
jgi:hypothetical protein